MVLLTTAGITHIGQVVVEVHIPSTKIASQYRSMRREYCGYWDVMQPTQEHPYTGHPFMELCHY